MSTENPTETRHQPGTKARIVHGDAVYVDVQDGHVILSVLLANVAFAVYGGPSNARTLAGYLNQAADMLEAGMENGEAPLNTRMN